jgi:predicted lipoprotein with Yx(FWY)xxD motif
MKKTFTFLLAIAWVLVLMSCDEDDKTNVIEHTIKLADNSALGKILTDKDGRTLYFFSKDTKGLSVCSGNCEAIWPVFFTDIDTVPDGLLKTDFSTITRTDGSKQTVYKGFPLYYFHQDAQLGDTKGEKVNNVWFVAKPDYSLFYGQSQLIGHDGKSYVANYELAAYQEGQGETAFLVDAEGRTLYTFKNDKNGVSNYAGSSAVWPAFYADPATLVVPSILDKNQFAEITKNGVKQLTFKGWPLYYFGGNTSAEPSVPGDINRGDTRGISFPSPGIWPVANVLTTTAPN